MPITFVVSARSILCPHVSARFLLYGFSWNLILETSMKIAEKIKIWLKERKISDTLHEDLPTFRSANGIRHKNAQRRILYCRQWHVAKQYTECIVAFPLQKKLLRECVTIFRYTYIVSIVSFATAFRLALRPLLPPLVWVPQPLS